MKTRCILLTLVLCSSMVGLAQENYFYINWDVNTPLTNKPWIDRLSTRGAKIGYRAFVGQERRISVGVDVNWAQFDEYKPKATFENESGAITTDYFNYIYHYGLTASGQYYFPVGESERLFPYVGLGLGANYNDYVVYYNIYSDRDKGFGFLARPEAGILVRLGSRRKVGLMAAVHYDYSTNKSENFNYSSFSTLGFQVGIISMQW